MIMVSQRRQRGFSLIELALGLVIVATLLAGLLVPLATQVEQRRWDETRRLLDDAREALLAFAAVNARLPCPATATSNGAEAPAGGGACSLQAGFLPAATLGMSGVDAQGYLSDPFGLVDSAGANSNRIRYAVRSSVDASFAVGAIANPLTTTGSISGVSPLPAGKVSLQSIAGSDGYLSVCAFTRAAAADTSCTGSGNYALANGNAVAVVFSLGPNGPAPASFSADELENTGDHLTAATGKLYFVSRPRDSAGTDQFDDQIVWISPSTLLARMIAAGTLP